MKNLNTKEDCPSIFVADDDDVFRSFIVDALKDDGYNVTEYNPVSSDKNLLKKQYDIGITDIIMPGMDGFEICREIQRNSPATQFIIMTGYADKEKLNRATDIGTYTFLVKPFRAAHIRYAVLGALRVKELVTQNLRSKAGLGTEEMGLVGGSQVMRSLRKQVSDLAPINIPVLITGDSGSGKEVVARRIHAFSTRSEKVFIPLNCAGLPATLIESELFGYVKGAFTGAVKSKHGFFKAADGGTLFLDEIGDLPIEMQTKLLRVLDNGEYTRLGETEPTRVDVRIISATNKNLEEMVENGRFRNDLFYRLKGTRITVPSLKEHSEDIPALVCYFLGDKKLITAKALALFEELGWPGNVRELKMAVEKIAGLSTGKMITEDMVRMAIGIQDDISGNHTTISSYNHLKEEFDKNYFKWLMHKSQSNISAASRMSGLDRKNLREKLKQLGIYEKTEIGVLS